MHIALDTTRRWAAWTLVAFVCTHLAPAPSLAAQTVGSVVLAKGSASARAADAATRALGKGARVHVGDAVTTAAESYVVIRFSDGGAITVRPESEVLIEQYAFGTDRDRFLLRLARGGLRVMTGTIAAEHPEAYRIETLDPKFRTQFSLGRSGGAEFDVRLCGDECEELP